MLPIAWIRAVTLTACVLVAMSAFAAPAAPPPAHRMSAFKRTCLRELASWRSVFKKPARLGRLALGTAASIGAAAAAGYLTGSPADAAFASFTVGVAADRLADHFMPGSRALGVRAPPPLLRDTLQTLAGGTVAALATPIALHVASSLPDGASVPGLFGYGAQLVLSRPVMQSIGGFVANRLASTTRWALQLIHFRRDAAPN